MVGAGEQDAAGAGLAGRLPEVDAADDVGAQDGRPVGLERLAAEVDNGVDALDQPVDRGGVGEVALHQLLAGRLLPIGLRSERRRAGYRPAKWRRSTPPSAPAAPVIRRRRIVGIRATAVGELEAGQPGHADQQVAGELQAAVELQPVAERHRAAEVEARTAHAEPQRRLAFRVAEQGPLPACRIVVRVAHAQRQDEPEAAGRHRPARGTAVPGRWAPRRAPGTGRAGPARSETATTAVGRSPPGAGSCAGTACCCLPVQRLAHRGRARRLARRAGGVTRGLSAFAPSTSIGRPGGGVPGELGASGDGWDRRRRCARPWRCSRTWASSRRRSRTWRRPVSRRTRSASWRPTAVERELGHVYRRVEEVEDEDGVTRRRYAALNRPGRPRGPRGERRHAAAGAGPPSARWWPRRARSAPS